MIPMLVVIHAHVIKDIIKLAHPVISVEMV